MAKFEWMWTFWIKSTKFLQILSILSPLNFLYKSVYQKGDLLQDKNINLYLYLLHYYLELLSGSFIPNKHL